MMTKTFKQWWSGVTLALAALAMACTEGEKGSGAQAWVEPQVPMRASWRAENGYFVATDGSSYPAGATINAAWSAPSNHSTSDAIGLYKVGTTDALFLARKYVPAGGSGMLSFTAPTQGGSYELRYLPASGGVSLSTSNTFSVTATTGATPGNIFLFSNYDGGTYTLVVDQNLPNIQIGIVSYAPSHVTLTGPYVGNVSVVRVSGYSTESTVQGIDASKVQLTPYEPVTLRQPYTNTRIVCGVGARVREWPGGGCNSTRQIEAYFLSNFGEVPVLWHMAKYEPFSGSIPLSTARLNVVVVRNTPHFNVATAAGSPSGPVAITVDVDATVGATTTLTPALTTGTLVAGSTVKINNYGNIVGAGGSGGSGGNGGGGGTPRTCSRDGLPGGTALHITAATTIDNRGNIWGGGGGGGGGSGCNRNAGGGGGAGYVGGGGGAGASTLSNAAELYFCGQDNGVRTGTPGSPGGDTGGAGGREGDYMGDGSYSMIGGDGGGYGQSGQPSSACVSASSGGAAGYAIKRNGYTVNVTDGAYDYGAGRIRGRVGS
jgi:hypothetical protein